MVQNGHFTATGIQSDPAGFNFGQITPREIKIPNQELSWGKDFSKMSFRGATEDTKAFLF